MWENIVRTLLFTHHLMLRIHFHVSLFRLWRYQVLTPTHKSYKPLIFLGFKLDHSTAGKLKTKQRWLTLTSIQNHQHMGVPLVRFTHPTVNKIVTNFIDQNSSFCFQDVIPVLSDVYWFSPYTCFSLQGKTTWNCTIWYLQFIFIFKSLSNHSGV